MLLPSLKTVAYTPKQTDELYFDANDALEEQDLKLIPYYAFANRGESDMLIWFNKKKERVIANQGMALEDMINRTNDYYLLHNIAFVNKRPTSVKILKTSDKYKITSEILTDAKNNVIPVAVSSKEVINELEDWAKGRALYSNKAPNEVAKKQSALDKLDEIDFDDII